MSAIEVNLVHYIKMVLNYLGLDPKYQQHFIGKKGRHRSLVRQIGTSLPLKPVRRAHFQIIRSRYPSDKQNRSPQFIEDDCEPLFIASLSDTHWIEICSPEKHIRSRTEFKLVNNREKSLLTHTPLPTRTCLLRRPREPDISELPDVLNATPNLTPSIHDPTAMEKIGQLEDELARLRAQIAIIVTLQQPTAVPTGVSPPLPSGGMAIPPPPPPPPPPPVCPIHTISVTEQIRQNRAKQGKKLSGTSEADKNLPDMADVLKGLGSVKLRYVARSPGGTPVRQKPRPSTANDAASLIARALQKKFARQLAESSPDQENRAWVSPSPKKITPSETSSKFGQHLLKPTKLNQAGRSGRPLVPINV